jgi:hypothetical protein
MNIPVLRGAHIRCLPCVVVGLAILSGCTHFWRNTYEGTRAHNAALSRPAGDNRPVMPDYDTYQHEREKLKKEQQPKD